MDEENTKIYMAAKEQKKALDKVIRSLDDSLDAVLKKQEHDYLKGYTIYVKQKEKELRELIQKLNEKNSNNTLKDEIIYKLKQNMRKVDDERKKMDEEKQKMKEDIKYWKTRSEGFEQDKNFLQT